MRSGRNERIQPSASPTSKRMDRSSPAMEPNCRQQRRLGPARSGQFRDRDYDGRSGTHEIKDRPRALSESRKLRPALVNHASVLLQRREQGVSQRQKRLGVQRQIGNLCPQILQQLSRMEVAINTPTAK